MEAVSQSEKGGQSGASRNPGFESIRFLKPWMPAFAGMTDYDTVSYRVVLGFRPQAGKTKGTLSLCSLHLQLVLARGLNTGNDWACEAMPVAGLPEPGPEVKN
jgi:hypothetical protein